MSSNKQDNVGSDIRKCTLLLLQEVSVCLSVCLSSAAGFMSCLSVWLAVLPGERVTPGTARL
jgi:hypothetical protein